MTDRPYTLPHWAVDGIRELLDTLRCLNDGMYETPKDLSDCLHATAESVRLVLDPSEFEDQTPQLLDAIAVLYIALQLAANECHIANIDPFLYTKEGHAGTFERWSKAAIDTLSTMQGAQQRDLITGTLARLAQLRAEVHQPGFHVVYAPPSTTAIASPATLPPWPAWLTPSDTPTVADLDAPDYEEPSDVY